MAFVVAPDFAIKSVDWSLKRPAQINVGAYNGVRTVAANPWFSQWAAHVDLALRQGESGFRLLRSFFAKCRGSVNVFRLYATPELQNANLNVTVASTAAQGATTITIAGYTTALLEGQFFTVNGQLCCCTADQATATLTFEPALRAQATAATPVVTSRPYALVYLANPQQSWNESGGRLFTMGFDVVEAINETGGVTVPETEIVTNGAFDGGTTTGWTQTAATASVVSGRLRVTNSGAAQGTDSQSIAALIPGKSYRLQADIFGGTTGASLAMSQQTNGVGTGSVVNQACGVSPATVHIDVTFTPLNSNPYYIVCYVGSSVSGQYAEFDNISLMEA